ncbi:ankyrin repeat-containing domain protein [Fusarium oxysporum]|nr:ankyrin repeat-containing domain protein [Fusarium oxysporum]
MNVGVGVGDFIKILELIYQARKRFVDASNQYDAISKDLKSFHNVILDIDILSSEWEPDMKQRETLQKVTDDSICLLNDLLARLDKYRVMGGSSTGMVHHAKKAWRKLNWDQNDTQDFRGRLSLNLELLNAVERQIHSQRFSRMEQKTFHITERLDQQHLHEIFDWFGTSDHGSRQSSLLDQHEEETCEWFLASAEFQEWIKTKDGMLFCPGLPGAGKTVLVSIVIHHLQTLFDNDGNTGIAYHYCDFRHQDNENVNLILSSILKQLAQCLDSIPEAMSTLYSMHKKRGTRPSLKEIASTLKTVVCLSSRNFIVIDGLDECLVWRDLMTELRGLQGVNILATSRVIPEIANDKGLKGSSVVEVHARETDIRKYLCRHMLKLGRFVAHNQQLQEDVCKAILGASGGMFLLARLLLDSLGGIMSIKGLRDALSTLPTGVSAYDEAYEGAMKRIESQHGDRTTVAKDVLAWLVFAKRPLTIEELRIAVIIRETDSNIDEDSLMDIKDMVSVCAGLVTVDEKNDRVTLIHYTTKEYLKRTWPTWTNWHRDAEVVIATSCLTYLFSPVFDVEFSEMDQHLEREKAGRQVYPLLDYSLHHAALHARLVAAMPSFLFGFRSSDSRIGKNWLLLIAKAGKEQGEDTIEWLIEQGVCTDVRDSKGRTPLHYAVLNGWVRCVQYLLGRGATMVSDVENMTPLHYTIASGNEAIARVFLRAGTPVDTLVTRQIHMATCQEDKAIYSAEESQQIVVRNSSKEQGLTPLHLAALTGSQRMTKFLLEHGANPNFPSDSDETPLHLALRQDLYGPRWPSNADFWKDPDNRVECVLEHIDSDDEGDYFRTQAWIEKERSATIDLLLECPETNLNAQDIFGISSLHIAAQSSHLSESVTQKLIDKGADISLRTKDKKTLLHFAILNGKAGVVSNLLKLGADPMAEDINGLNLLHCAARKQNLRMLQDVLEHIPDFQQKAFLQSKDKKGKNVLHHLLSKRALVDIPVAKYLLGRYNDMNGLDNRGMSPVAVYLSASVLSADQDDQELLNLLFSNGADPDFKTAEGLGLVHVAASSRRCSVGVLQTLAKWGIDLMSLDSQGRTVLHHSSIKGTLVEDVLHFLCHDIKLPVDLRDVHGKTALDYAVEIGQQDHSPDLFQPDRWIRTERLLRGVEKE